MSSQKEQEPKSISTAVEELEEHLATTARVSEWARLMGYDNQRRFSRHFVRHFRERPSRVLSYVRLKSVIRELRTTTYSHLEIAWRHSMPDEKALYNFVRYHAGCSPSEVKEMSEKAIVKRVEIFGSDIRGRI